MRLIDKTTRNEINIGDIVSTSKGEQVEVIHFREPHKASSSGKVSVKSVAHGWSQEFFVGVIGAEWIEREDQAQPEPKKSVGMSHDLFEDTMTIIGRLITQVYQAEVATFYNVSNTAAEALRRVETELTVARDCMGDDDA